MADRLKDAPSTHPPLLTTRQTRAIELTVRYVLLVALVLVFIGPFVWMLSISFRQEGNIYALELLPENMTFQYYVEVWTQYNLARAFLNSILVAAGTVISNIVLCSLAAYPLARMRFRGSRLMFLLILCTMMVPFQLYMIPLFLLSLNLSLFDTIPGIIVPLSVGAFGIYLIKQYYQTIPMDLEEAARIDGANEFEIWWRIMFPLTKPAVAAMSIFIFVQSWSNFLWPLIVTDSPERAVLPVAVARLSGDFIDKTQYIAAGSVIAVAPVIVLFFFLQRWFIGGLTLGGVKG